MTQKIDLKQIRSLLETFPKGTHTTFVDSKTHSGFLINKDAILSLLDAIESMREALEYINSRTESFIDPITPEGLGRPDYPLAHRGMIQMLHFYNKAREALAKFHERFE